MSVNTSIDVNALIQRYERHRRHYRAGSSNEDELRVSFIDPLFTALGWDVRNEADRTHRLIAATDRENDHLVYELYDLTDEEIAIVEEEVG